MSYAGLLSSGGIGFSIDYSPLTVEVTLTSTSVNSCSGFSNQRLENILDNLSKKYNLPMKGWIIKVKNPLRPHIGLGSTTQVEAQILTSLMELGSDKQPKYLDFIQNRIGVESGIGLKCFLRNGFHIDFGYWRNHDKRGSLNSSDATTNSIFLQLPEEWRVLLMIPKYHSSVSGRLESAFWESIIPVDESHAHKISFHILMGIIPSILENRFLNFIHSMNAISELGTKPEERRLNNKYIHSLYEDVKTIFGFCGLSSLGPTCYAFYINNESSNLFLNEIKNRHENYLFIQSRIVYE